ncbi:general substrate transporter [Annulohypoxylon truncatum]|uniref:general substrate transporter n=1 Tax=Annulohypoxylon truncatum TaxID=327061 RepID=UPI00200816F4|nr:general substrate transporter [Annulohypoxylon truncatum]KAI1212035.1 general substrate transporter [Annulohypoxylon truncatum]
MVSRNQHSDGIKRNWKCALICVGMAFAMAQYGVDVTAVGAFQSMPGFLMTFGYPDPQLKGGWGISTTDQQLITSFLNLGTIIGVLFIVPFSRYFGRRHGIWMGSILSFASCVTQIVSTSIPGLCVGRALMGASNAFFITFCNTYIVECAPPNLRAICSAMFAITMNVGTIIGATVDENTSHMMNKLSYQIPLACLFIFPVFLGVFMFFIPESPRWLMLHDRREEAIRSLAFLRDDSLESDLVHEEIVEIVRGVEEEKLNASSSSITDIFKGSNLRRTLICLSVVVSRTSSGTWVLLSYGTYFFQQAGVDDVFRIGIYMMLLAFASVGAGIFFAYKVFGRRTMLLIGTGGAVISMLGSALGATIAPETAASAKTFLAFNFFYVVLYGGFAGSMTWPISAEVVNSRLRVVTLSFATGVDYIFAWLTSFCSPYFINPTALNWGAKYCWIWAASNALTFAVFWFFLPDMKGRSLEEIDELFEKRVPARNFQTFECQSSSQAHDIVLHKMEEAKVAVQHIEKGD